MSTAETYHRYAKALHHLVRSKDEKCQLDSLLTESATLMKTHSLLSPFLKHPQIDLASKKHVLETSLHNPLLVHFMLLLIECQKLQHLPGIAFHYHQLLMQEMEIKEATLITALPMSAEVKIKLQLRLERAYQTPFIVHEEIDPQMIGGAIISIGNSWLDYSLKGRLRGLHNYLLKGHHGT